MQVKSVLTKSTLSKSGLAKSVLAFAALAQVLCERHTAGGGLEVIVVGTAWKGDAHGSSAAPMESGG